MESTTLMEREEERRKGERIWTKRWAVGGTGVASRRRRATKRDGNREASIREIAALGYSTQRKDGSENVSSGSSRAEIRKGRLYNSLRPRTVYADWSPRIKENQTKVDNKGFRMTLFNEIGSRKRRRPVFQP